MNVDVQQFFSAEQCLNFLLLGQWCVGKLNYSVFVLNKYGNFTTGKLWSRSLKLAYTLLNKLGTKTEPVLQPGDRVRVTPVPQ